jgi:hypothetical protein
MWGLVMSEGCCVIITKKKFMKLISIKDTKFSFILYLMFYLMYQFFY